MSALVEHAHVFGLKSDVADNVCYLDEQNIIYPVGNCVVLYNVDQKKQRFIQGTEEMNGITALAISPNRRYVAIAEHGTHASVSIFDLHSLRKRKVLMFAESNCTEFVCMTFSPDSKYLVTLGGAPEFSLLYWAWEKTQGPMAVTKCSASIDAPVHRVTFNPGDNTNLCVTGNTVLKIYRYTDGNLKQLALQKLEPQNYTAQAWLSNERMVVGTDKGNLFIFQGSELKTEINITDRINVIVPLSRGFIVGCASGAVHVFEKSDNEKEMYKKQKEIFLPNDTKTTQGVHHIAVSPSEEFIVCTTDTNQIYHLPLSAIDRAEAVPGEEVSGLELLAQAFHHGPVTGIDVAVRKPLVATSGLDRSVRIWNYIDHSLDLIKYFSEDALSISIHPSGLFVLVGFEDKLRLMSLLMDDIRPIKEFPIRECRECKFAHGGHLFAAAQGNIIQLYSSWTYQNVGNLKGHNGRVRSICWGADDNKLVSCGIDGAVYEWDIQRFNRSAENVLKSCSYTCVAVAPDSNSTFAVGSDKSLKEITGNEIVKDIQSKNEAVLTQVAMSSSGRMLIAGAAHGVVRSYKYPIVDQGEWTTQCAHLGVISKMCISSDDQYLFTVGEDSCVFIYKLSDKDGRTSKREKDVVWADELLITSSDLKEKNSTTHELKQRVEELQMSNEYQLRLKDMNYNEKIKEMTDKFIQEKEDLKRQLQAQRADKEKEEVRHDEEVNEIHLQHTATLQDMENQFNQKLMVEYEKFQELQQRSLAMQEDYEMQLKKAAASKEKALADLTEFWEKKLLEKTGMLEQVNQLKENMNKENEEMKRQIEIDADREILGLKVKYEKLLKEERESTTQLKSDAGILRKKLQSLQSEISGHQKQKDDMLAEQKRLQTHIKALERDIQSCKKEIEERDETIQDKEKRIFDLKKKNQELEKFKFVLDYKIQELKKQIEPREVDITQMRSQISQMDEELAKYHQMDSSLNLKLEEQGQKLTAADNEVSAQRIRLSALRNYISRFRGDVEMIMTSIQDPKNLTSQFRSLHKKYCAEKANEESLSEEDSNVHEEYNKQREFLERNIASLKKKLERAAEMHETDTSKLIQENVALIRELNQLRAELSNSKTSVKKLEGTLKTTRKLAEMRSTTGAAGSTTQAPLPSEEEVLEMSGTLRSTLAETHKGLQVEKVLELQKEEIRRLRETVKKMEMLQPERPPSTGRLPPMST